MERIKKHGLFFIAGGIGYGILEILWRGYTHWSMIIAGGICFITFGLIAEKFKNRHIIYKSLLCALAVTTIELAFGIVFNLIFNMAVWDYTDVPFNFLGQICPTSSLIWGILGFVFLPLAEYINLKFED